MKKIKTTKITEKFDENGKLIERVTEEITEEKDEPITINSPWQSPSIPQVWYSTTQNTNDNITVSNRSEEE